MCQKLDLLVKDNASGEDMTRLTNHQSSQDKLLFDSNTNTYDHRTAGQVMGGNYSTGTKDINQTFDTSTGVSQANQNIRTKAVSQSDRYFEHKNIKKLIEEKKARNIVRIHKVTKSSALGLTANASKFRNYASRT